MTSRIRLALIFAATFAASPLIGVAAAHAGCPAVDRIDRSTAAQATHEMERAGYAHVRDLKKGCDNFWHGVAMRDGKQTGVALSPKGEVLAEDDNYQGATHTASANR